MTSSLWVISPFPSMFGRPGFQPDHVFLHELEFRRSLRSSRSVPSPGMKRERTFRSVVLPLPVPPEIRTLQPRFHNP